MVTKTWRMGLPTMTGNFVLLDRADGAIRLVKAVDLGGVVRTYANGTEIEASDTIVSFGPIPNVDRSLSSGARKPVAQAS